MASNSPASTDSGTRGSQLPGDSTVAVHGGRRPTPSDPDVSPPIRRSSTFLQHPGTHAATDAGDWVSPLVYTRYRNPNVEDAEIRIAALERAESAVLFASGMAAIHALLVHAVPGGQGRVAVARQIYGGTTALFAQLLGADGGRGVEAVSFDVTDPGDLARVLDSGVQLVHVEGLSNPTAVVADLARIAEQSHAQGVRVSVDSTFATPIVQRPLELGADFVVHSATKALSGHSDVTAGVVLGRSDDMAAIAGYRKVTGAILDPGAAWLLARSLPTLDLRVRAQCHNALALARALESAPGVARVHYPGLESSACHGLAEKMLRSGLHGSVLAIELEGGDGATRGYVERLGLAIDAPSLGGVETLVSIPAYMSHVALSPEERLAAGIGPGCVRIAAGIEDAADLVADFVQALG
ncbi:Methionine gamma-lyase [Planctomycetes bacterium Poly30]|uniref:Methionine gamma-lyase n=1 Tax=Saltatorellus ferox TaxID=2528018 RepID=A0A518EX26_9BACT|nr:Methionine gamma-lyase [Planctomycetes bacterium Poly30]